MHVSVPEAQSRIGVAAQPNLASAAATLARLKHGKPGARLDGRRANDHHGVPTCVTVTSYSPNQVSIPEPT